MTKQRELYIRAIKQAQEIHRREAPKSIYYTLQLIWPIIIQDEFQTNWHIPYICDELQKISQSIIKREVKPYDLIINVCPGATKSTIGLAWDVWLWLNDPSLVIIASSFTADLSIKFSNMFKSIITSPEFNSIFQPYYKKEFGEYLYLEKDTEKLRINNFKGERIATSTGGSITGSHGHLIRRDDPMDPKQSKSPAYRKTAHAFNDRTLGNRKKQKQSTPTVTFMQRLDEDDSTAHDLKKKGKKLKHICLPATCTKFVKPPELKEMYINGLFDPIRLSKEILASERIDVGDIDFMTQYEQDPTPQEGLLYREFNTYNRGDLPNDIIAVNNYTDTADEGTDKLFSCTYAKTLSGRILVLDIVYSDKAMEDTEPMTADLMNRTNTRLARIESNNGGRGFARAVGKLTRITKIKWFHQSGNKQGRILTNSSTVNKFIEFPSNWKQMWPELYDDLKFFKKDYVSNKFKDAPDVLTGIVEFEVVGTKNRVI